MTVVTLRRRRMRSEMSKAQRRTRVLLGGNVCVRFGEGLKKGRPVADADARLFAAHGQLMKTGGSGIWTEDQVVAISQFVCDLIYGIRHTVGVSHVEVFAAGLAAYLVQHIGPVDLFPAWMSGDRVDCSVGPLGSRDDVLQ